MYVYYIFYSDTIHITRRHPELAYQLILSSRPYSDINLMSLLFFRIPSTPPFFLFLYLVTLT
jgi:hypothetical protein